MGMHSKSLVAKYGGDFADRTLDQHVPPDYRISIRDVRVIFQPE